MYMYSPTSEYRLLLYPNPLLLHHANLLPDTQDGYYVFTIGSGQVPRHVGCPDAERLVYDTISVLFHGSMHWYTDQMIMVFDITTELFRRMRSPIVSSKARLFEIGGMFGMSSLKDEASTATMDIWMMQDYESEVWAFKHRVELPVAPLTLQFGEFHSQWSVVVPSGDGDLLVLLNFGDWLLQMDIDGKLVASFHRKFVSTTQLRLKQTLVPQTFFPTLEDYVVNTSPFT
uniref:Uncharacterized protein n=1 Tax=Avena sativa TaxID=4498 RepID=A0ACD5VWB6_AVESA